MSDENQENKKLLKIKKYEYKNDNFEVYSINEINKSRVLLGLPLLKNKKRSCINCKKEIKTIHERLCPKCRYSANNNGSCILT